MDELKECPFCGAKAELHNMYQEKFYKRWRALCINDNCGATIYKPNKEELIKAWNNWKVRATRKRQPIA